jgi:hypothetical protein
VHRTHARTSPLRRPGRATREAEGVWRPGTQAHPPGVWDDVATILAGLLFVAWPLQYRRSVRRVRGRVARRGGDVERFRATMNRRWIRVALRVAPVVGVLLIIDGVVSLVF